MNKHVWRMKQYYNTSLVSRMKQTCSFSYEAILEQTDVSRVNQNMLFMYEIKTCFAYKTILQRYCRSRMKQTVDHYCRFRV